MARYYQYRCPAGHERTRRHPMAYDQETICICGEKMHRVPQPFMVQWNGLAPSQGALGPAALDLLDPAKQEERIEAYAAKKAARGEEWTPPKVVKHGNR